MRSSPPCAVGGWSLADNVSSSKRALLVTGAVFLWVLALLWTLGRKGHIDAPAFVGGEAAKSAQGDVEPPEQDEMPVSELVVDGGEGEPGPEPTRRTRSSSEPPEDLPAEAIPDLPMEEELPAEEPEIPTYSVWFESERSIGVCKISYEGGNKTANLHVATRVPEGLLEFDYRCGKYRGSGRIEVKPRRVNGVLFCKQGTRVKVKTVRSKDGRCARN